MQVLTMFPASVDPRANANMVSLHPPRENSLEVVRVWRISIAAELARPTRRAEVKTLAYMMIGVVDLYLRVNIKRRYKSVN